jgi:ATP-dependent Clp protease ATP-binding subunit ClpX
MSDHRIGFHSGNTGKGTDNEIRQAVLSEDLGEYGFIPELIGRLPVVVALNGLDLPDMVRVLTEPKNAVIKQFKQLFALDGVELSFTPAALESASAQALGRKTGARGLRTIIEEALLDVMFELPSLEHVEKCLIDIDSAGKLSKPRLLSKSGQVIEISGLGGARSA